MAASVLDFWFDFASTYSYPATMRIGALAEHADVRVRFRPILLGPIFKAQGWTTSPFNLYPAKGRHMWRDLERMCAELSLPFRRPDPFPQNSLLAARVAVAALDQAWGENFCRTLFRAEFGNGMRIDDAASIGDVLAGLGVEPQPVLAAAQSDGIKGRLRAQTDEAQRLGVFGAPSFTTADGELFWGNDRLEQALRWASQGSSRIGNPARAI
jgi:2-hydroxychromene-2-carboxylate isomerase